MAHNIPATFKVKFSESGEIRRIPACATLCDLNNKLSSYWGNHSFALTYLDEDNDLIKVTCDSDFEEAIAVAREMHQKVLKFNATIINDTEKKKKKNTPYELKSALSTEIKQGGHGLKKVIKNQKKPASLSKLQPVYASMIKAGICEEAVEQRMVVDGCSQSFINSTMMRGGPIQKEVGSFYANMLHAGVPWLAVKDRMARDGYELHSKYDNMLMFGITCDAVILRMQNDGYEFPTKSQPSRHESVASSSASPSSAASSAASPSMEDYTNMLRLGSPWIEVAKQMKSDGVRALPSEFIEEHNIGTRAQFCFALHQRKPLKVTKKLMNIPTPVTSIVSGSSPPMSRRQVTFGEVLTIPTATEAVAAVVSAAPTTSTVITAVSSPATSPATQSLVLLYASQLEQLESMGFVDGAKNLSLLAIHQGRVDLVLNSIIAMDM